MQFQSEIDKQIKALEEELRALRSKKYKEKEEFAQKLESKGWIRVFIEEDPNWGDTLWERFWVIHPDYSHVVKQLSEERWLDPEDLKVPCSHFYDLA